MSAAAVDQTVQADLDGDGQTEIVQLMSDASTRVLRSGAVVWSTPGQIDGWHRRVSDVVASRGVDVDGDGGQEVVIFNGQDSWIGLLKWQSGRLTCPWGTGAAFLTGPAGTWNRRPTDAFGVTEWQGRPAISITHDEDQWYGTLAWHAGAPQLVAFWQNGLLMRKFTFLIDTFEVTGVVSAFVPALDPCLAPPQDKIGRPPAAPTMDLVVEPGLHAVFDSVLGPPARADAERILHCETYGCGISVPEWNGDTQINAMKSFEPWPADHYGWSNGGAALEMTTAVGASRPIKAMTDRIRVRGRLIIENGHPSDGPPGFPVGPDRAYRSGRPFLELHPFDWRGITEDPLPTDSTGVRTHDLLLIAPLYEAVEMRDRPDGQFPDQIDRLVTLNASPPPFHNSVSTSCVFAAPPAPAQPAPLQFVETVLINGTGRPIEELRTITVAADHIVVDARVDAVTDSAVGPFALADPRHLADTAHPAVLQIRYQLSWAGLPRKLVVPGISVPAGPRAATVNVQAFDEAAAHVDGDVLIEGTVVARTFQDFSWAFAGHWERQVERDDRGHPHVTRVWVLDAVDVTVRAPGFADAPVAIASDSDV